MWYADDMIKLPVLMSDNGTPVIDNNNDYDVKGRIFYNNVILIDNFILEPNTTNNMIFVDVSKIYNSLSIGDTYSLDLTFTSPVIETYEDVVDSFISFDISKYSNKVINLQVTGNEEEKQMFTLMVLY